MTWITLIVSTSQIVFEFSRIKPQIEKYRKYVGALTSVQNVFFKAILLLLTSVWMALCSTCTLYTYVLISGLLSDFLLRCSSNSNVCYPVWSNDPIKAVLSEQLIYCFRFGLGLITVISHKYSRYFVLELLFIACIHTNA